MEKNEITGSVILFKDDKGYGFIRPKDGGENVYVHRTALLSAGLETLTPGQRLRYEISTHNDKISAINIALLDVPKSE